MSYLKPRPAQYKRNTVQTRAPMPEYLGPSPKTWNCPADHDIDGGGDRGAQLLRRVEVLRADAQQQLAHARSAWLHSDRCIHGVGAPDPKAQGCCCLYPTFQYTGDVKVVAQASLTDRGSGPSHAPLVCAVLLNGDYCAHPFAQ